MSNTHVGAHPMIPRFIRLFCVPIVLGWLALTVLVNVIAPQLEAVGEAHAVSLAPNDAPSMQAMQRVGKDFKEFDSNSSVMVVLEGDQPLGQDAHKFYDGLIDKLEADTKHVEHVQDFWGDPLTAAGSQSADGKSAYVQLYLRGNQGETIANESVAAVRNIVSSATPPPGLKAYVTGPAALTNDQHHAGDKSIKLITMITICVIFLMLLFVYRSITTVLIVLVTMFIELAAARGIVSTLGYYNIIGLSTFAVNLLTTLAIAAATDYGIFLIGRYQEARANGEDRETAFYTMYHGTAHVILGSGLTIAGATFCLHFTRLPYFQTLGVPLAIGILVATIAALTMAPAIMTILTRFGLLDPKRALRTRGWRKIGAAVVRWPGPILVSTIALALVGLLALPGYVPSYNDREFLPNDIPANLGYAAADRHFPQARMNPEMLLVETNHDVRNSADMLVVDRIAKNVFHIPGIGRVQTITRPLGTPIEHTSIPFQISMQGTTQQMNQDYMQARMADMLTQAAEMDKTIATMEKMQALTKEMSDTTHSMVEKTKNMAIDIGEVRDNIADFDDFLRPIRNYFYWEPHCYDVPVCHSLRAIFDTLDGIDVLTDDVQQLVPDLEHLDTLLPQLTALMPEMISTMRTMKTMMLTMYQSQKGMQDQMAALQENSTAMGQAFDASKNDDSFYLPPEVFSNP
ncbi:MAG: MMPL/RND family transporter, partial [Ilumatobacteraceae bacterium]